MDMKSGKTPAYLRIAAHYRDQILQRRLLHGFRLPSERALAAELSVSRDTVIRAFEVLKEEGYIVSREKKYYEVNHPDEGETAAEGNRSSLSWEYMVNEPYRHPLNLFDKIHAQSISGNYITLASEFASPEIYPVQTIAELMRQIAGRLTPELVGQAPNQGLLQLRQAICQMLKKRHIHANPSEIQIFSESTQAIVYFTKLYLSPGDTVLMEQPVYPDALSYFQEAEIQIVTVPSDEAGMRTDLLEAIVCKHRPKLMFLIPTFNNPTKTVLPLARRRQIMEVSGRYNIPIMEEDSMYATRFAGQPVPPLKALDKKGHVIYLDSFSDSCTPGMALSYAVAPKEVVARFQYLVARDGMRVDVISQLLLTEYMNQGYHDENITKISEIYRRKLQVLMDALDAGEGLFSYRVPEGSVGLWCRIPPGIAQEELLRRTRKQGVLFMPGHLFFYKAENEENYLRICFALASDEDIRFGVSVIISCMRQMLAEQGR